MDVLSGSVARITYHNPDNGYTVLRLDVDSKGSPQNADFGVVTVVGVFPEISQGETIEVQGEWVVHPRHGEQFSAKTYRQIPPVTTDGIRRYLGSGLIKGIGPALAESIVRYFGDETLTVIDEHPERLLEVPDIGRKRLAIIEKAWKEQKQVRETMLFLYANRITKNLAVKIYKTYGENTVQIVKNDPYRLARDIYGVGFKTADRIAQNLGLPREHPTRLEAGLVHVLNDAAGNGDVFLPQELLLKFSVALLGVDEDLILQAIERLRDGALVFIDDVPMQAAARSRGVENPQGGFGKAVYLSPFYHAEASVARQLAALIAPPQLRLSGVQSLLIPESGLSEEQRQAVSAVLTQPVSVLTGGPGTGKTTTMRALIAVLDAAKKKVALASPTGRAAKRLSEATGRSASTIHRLLKYRPGEGFAYDENHPLPVDLLVVDEASMLDLILANHLLRALSPGTHVLFIGDVDQLPPVGAGDVLRDLIASGAVHVTRLQKIYRQAQGSQIILNAHKINRGEMPAFSRAADQPEGGRADFFLFSAEDALSAANWVIDVVSERIPQRFGFHPVRDVQVLAPMYRGDAGVLALNRRLQEKLNPASAGKTEASLGGRVFREGDKVMQIRNDYDKDVFNGDIGFIEKIMPIAQSLEVNFDDRIVLYDWTESDNLVHAYAVSVHKSQGSEFPVVVMPLVTQHYMMLQRNLLYTAVTRAKEVCVLVGNKKAIGIALRNDKTTKRFTALGWRIGRMTHSAKEDARKTPKDV